MAEFSKVMKQAKRMCETVCACAECGLWSGDNCRFEEILVHDEPVERIAEMERIVMDWAAEHPEPRYPSWKEAWGQAFPNGGLVPCPMHFDARCKPDDCSSCSACKERPIPADIAEKLGIKPIGGDER